jgi:hypothetical protein
MDLCPSKNYAEMSVGLAAGRRQPVARKMNLAELSAMRSAFAKPEDPRLPMWNMKISCGAAFSSIAEGCCIVVSMHNDRVPNPVGYGAKVIENIPYSTTNVSAALVGGDLYPIDKRKNNGIFYTYEDLALIFIKDVSVMLDSDLHPLPKPFYIDMIICPALESPACNCTLYANKEDMSIVMKKQNMIVLAALSAGHKRMIIGDWSYDFNMNPPQIFYLWCHVLRKYAIETSFPTRSVSIISQARNFHLEKIDNKIIDNNPGGPTLEFQEVFGFSNTPESQQSSAESANFTQKIPNHSDIPEID